MTPPPNVHCEEGFLNIQDTQGSPETQALPAHASLWAGNGQGRDLLLEKWVSPLRPTCPFETWHI